MKRKIALLQQQHTLKLILYTPKKRKCYKYFFLKNEYVLNCLFIGYAVHLNFFSCKWNSCNALVLDNLRTSNRLGDTHKNYMSNLIKFFLQTLSG